MPHLVQILLPIYDNAGNRFPPDVYAKVRFDLTQRFGGLTAYSRAPAEGRWDGGKEIKRDDIMVLEVRVEELRSGGATTDSNCRSYSGRMRSSCARKATNRSNLAFAHGRSPGYPSTKENAIPNL